MRQRTIGKLISFSSPSACSDEETNMSLIPAVENTGIVFLRTDLDTVVPLQPRFMKNGKWSRLEYGNVTVETTEHILAAMRGLEIDNVIITLDRPGVPLMDGSALPFVNGILDAGIVMQNAILYDRCPVVKPEIVSRKMVDFRTGDERGKSCVLIAAPDSNLNVGYFLQYDGTALQDQWVEFGVTPDVFASQIAPARTFMTPWEIERWGPSGNGMLSRYFCDTVQVVSETEAFEERIPNEAASHKVLDIIGDMSIFGRFVGKFFGIRSGHTLNGEMVRRLSCG